MEGLGMSGFDDRYRNQQIPPPARQEQCDNAIGYVLIAVACLAAYGALDLIGRLLS
jgi:hypothetical protein